MANTAREVVRAIVGRLASTTGRALHAFDRHPPQGEEFLRRLLRHLPGMAYRCRNDEAGTMEFVSPGCRVLTGFSSEDLVDNAVVAYADLIHPDDREAVHHAVQDAIVRASSFQITYRIRRVDGQERLVWEQGTAVLDEQGAVAALEGLVTDITEHAELAARSADRDRQYRALVEQSLTGVVIVGDGGIQYANPRLAEIFGYTGDELLALPSLLEIVHPGDRDVVAESIRGPMEGEADELRHQFRVQRRDGAIRFVEAHGRRVDLAGGPAIMATVLDVTERQQRERLYHERQKMEALGRLSAGLAHDLNNFLTVIRTTAELAMLDRADDEGLARDLTEVIQTTHRGAALSRQLVHFSRPNESSSQRVALDTLVHSLRPSLERVLGPGIELRLVTESDLPEVAMDATRAEEVVMNLVLNAWDAMPSGGTLAIRVARRAAPDPAATTPAKAEHVVLEVSDTGVGISAEEMKHIFEPYFTTKGEKGTGLGLANVWRIVRDAGGLVEVDAEPGAGATFRAFVPAFPPAVEGA